MGMQNLELLAQGIGDGYPTWALMESESLRLQLRERQVRREASEHTKEERLARKKEQQAKVEAERARTKAKAKAKQHGQSTALTVESEDDDMSEGGAPAPSEPDLFEAEDEGNNQQQAIAATNAQRPLWDEASRSPTQPPAVGSRDSDAAQPPPRKAPTTLSIRLGCVGQIQIFLLGQSCRRVRSNEAQKNTHVNHTCCSFFYLNGSVVGKGLSTFLESACMAYQDGG